MARATGRELRELTMNLPDYRLDPPEEHEVKCSVCVGYGRIGSGRVDDPAEDPLIDCPECDGGGTLLLSGNAYTNYLRQMKEAD